MKLKMENNNIDNFHESTPFFYHGFGKAFPGIRGVKEFNNPKECIDRLEILLRNSLQGKYLSGAIWWFRGSSNMSIDHFERVSDTKFLMDGDEVKVKRIVAFYSSEYYKEFVYVEAYPEKPSGVYDYLSAEYIENYRNEYGVYHEEYAVFNNNKITRAEYDDGAAIIDGKPVDLEGKAKLRIRYLTPYNFIICAQFNPINNNSYDTKMRNLLDGILENNHSVDEIVDFVRSMPRHKRDY